ncbi:hypothetical protein [Burkholderia perseverans]|uniref:hypothetical protein n=1 Tax=Burkholderia perseverans TaxID=2615214 RepID=UPI001FEE2494|nr:hypothetical protein [Burkholderia perseverans]
MRFRDSVVSRAGRYALGIDMVSGRPSRSIPAANRLVDYGEHHPLSPHAAEQFAREPEAARRFADVSRAAARRSPADAAGGATAAPPSSAMSLSPVFSSVHPTRRGDVVMFAMTTNVVVNIIRESYVVKQDSR